MKAAFFWKNVLNVSYAKILHHIFIPKIYENFKSVFFLSRTNGNFETCVAVWFEQLKELKQFKVLSVNNILTNGHSLKNVKDDGRWKLLHVNIQFLYENFSCTRNKETSSCW